jgi:hypothetical protein
MFYYASYAANDTIRVDSLPNQGNPAYWLVVPVCSGVVLHFALLNPDTDPLGKLIASLTQSAVYHVAIELTDDAPAPVLAAVLAGLGMPYDVRGAVLSWQNTGYHTPGEEFCSGYGFEAISPVVAGLDPYPNPGHLLMQLCQSLKLPPPALGMFAVHIGPEEKSLLESLHASGKLAEGEVQEILAVTGETS